VSKKKFRRTFTEEQRVAYVNEVLSTGSNVLIAKKYDISQVQLSNWVCNYRRYKQTLPPAEPKESEVIPNYKKLCKELEKEKADLELELLILKEILKKNS
jgi:transposase-like protein